MADRAKLLANLAYRDRNAHRPQAPPGGEVTDNEKQVNKDLLGIRALIE
ncbi:MAG: hypothetical protein ACRDQI_13925 [Pseudonocardiaceae bacterium]